MEVKICFGSDEVDSSFFPDEMELHEEELDYPSPTPAADILKMMSPPLNISPPHFSDMPAGDVLRKYKPICERKYDRRAKVDRQLSIQDIEEESYVFKSRGASKSVKHFYESFLPEEEDTVDAGAEGATGTSDQTDTDVFSTSHKDDKVFPETASTFVVNTKDFFYSMKNKERGCFIIFNQRTFDAHLHLDTRFGTNIDAENLENTMKQLGFEHIKILTDCTKAEIISWIKAISGADHSVYDCFGCAILTHGGDKDVLYAKDDKMDLKDFMRPFGADRCPTLATKPKLFFIQACRGFKLASSVRVTNLQCDSLHQDTTDGGGPKEEMVTIPAEADFLIAQSTVKEYYSWRNKGNGSIFIQALCATLNIFGDQLEINQIMTRVNRMVAFDFQSSSQDETKSGKKQIPSITSQLTAELYFPRKRKELSSVGQYSQQVTSPHTSLSETPTTSRYEYDAYSFQSTSQVDNNVVQSSTNFSHIHAAAGDPCMVEGAAAYPRTGDATAEPPIQGAIRKRKNFFPIKQHQTSTARQPHMSGDSTPPRRLSYETSFTSSPAVGIPLGRKQSSPANVYSSSMDSHISRPVHPSRTDPSRLSAHFITNPTQKNLNRRSYPSIVPPGSPLCVSSWEGGINRAGRKSIQQTDL